MAILAVALSANAQWLDFSNNSNRYELGLNLGMDGLHTEFNDFGLGVSLSAWGVYFDFIGVGPKYRYDNHVRDETNPAAMVPDSTVMTFNLGYQIPILPWFRIMPLIGYTHTTHGYTDLSTVNIQSSGSD